jgi:hypothetical protein
VDSTGEVHDYVLQASETDYAFLRRRAGRIGFYFWISEQTFHFTRKPRGSGAPPPLRWGGNLRRFAVRFASTERCDEVQVNGWDPLAKRTITGQSAEGDPGTDAPAAAEMAAAARRGFGQVRRSAGHFPVADQAEGDALARSLLLRTSGTEVILRGEATGDPRLGAGAEVQIEQVGTRLAGKYRITSVEHIYGTGRLYLTRFVCGGKEAAGLADLVGTGAGTTAVERKGWGSLVIGIVTNNDDPEKLGRVKVIFPTLTEQDESTWARLVVPGGGPRRGMQWLPEVDDEVLVGFEHDDKTRPVVLGGVWNRKDPPPQPDVVSGGAVQARVLASRRDSRLVMTDDPTPAVHLSLGGDSCHVHLEQSESRLTGDKKLVISANQIEIKATQLLSLSGARVEVTGEPIKLN